MAQGNFRIADLGAEALEYAKSELRLSADGFGGRLAHEASLHELGRPFAVVDRQEQPPQDLRVGGIGRGMDRVLAVAIRSWLRAAPVSKGRTLILEDPFARSTDPLPRNADQRLSFVGDHVFFVAHGGSDQEVLETLRAPAEYPGIGGLFEHDASEGDVGDLIQTAADSCSAVLARAWDGEGFLVAPVASRLAPSELVALG